MLYYLCTKKGVDMKKDYVFLDERGQDITNIAFIDIGDKIINANGEWVCEGLVSEIKTKEIYPTFFEKLFRIKETITCEKEYSQKIVLKRVKKSE